MNRWIAATVLWLAVIGVTLADVKITGETKVPVYEFVELKAEGAAEGSGYSWKVFDAKRNRLSSKSVRIHGGKLIFVAAPGTYTVELSAFSYDEKTKQINITETDVKVVIEGKELPNPQPNPDPGPNPQPNPVVDLKSGSWVLVVEETSESTEKRGKWLSHQGLAKYIKSKNWKAAAVDKDVTDANGKTPANFQPWRDKAIPKGLPYIFVFDPKGNVAWEGQPPATPDDFLKQLKKLGGD